ncbi:MAG TPA: cytochrome c biogenesis protein CcsA [Gemmatimonadales bacterium]|nr:cytochrome c biogenesis protein CcsA [Gemmatimonadales bacterium]
MMSMIERGRKAIRTGLALTAVALAGLAGVYVMALQFTPVERLQGPAQKIFYVHAPAAWAALMAFAIVGIVSILYLWLRDERLDHFAAASAEVGLAFSCVMLTTGPIWAKPIWGAWWTWDARLTFTLFLFFLFLGYLTLRSALSDPSERARFSAVVGILGMLLVPFVHLSVYLFRTLHPQPVLMKPSAPSMPPEMLQTLLTSFAFFTLLYLGFTITRYGIALVRDAQEARDAG